MENIAPNDRPVKLSVLSYVAYGALGASVLAAFFETASPQQERAFALFLGALLVAIQAARLEAERRRAE